MKSKNKDERKLLHHEFQLVSYYRKFLKSIQRDFYKEKVYLAMLLELLTKLSEFNYVEEIAEEIVKASYLHVWIVFG